MFVSIKYNELNPKQKEIFNYQKVAAKLADYGYNCIKLADDWNNADFLAYHKDGVITMYVQLKSRLTIDKKYIGKNLFIAFPTSKGWCIILHDDLMRKIKQYTPWLKSKSWNKNGSYSSASPSKTLIKNLKNSII